MGALAKMNARRTAEVDGEEDAAHWQAAEVDGEEVATVEEIHWPR